MDKFALKAKGFIDISGQEARLHKDEMLLIEGERIAGFVKLADLPSEIQVIDFVNGFVLPGLVDLCFLPHMMFDDEGAPPDNYGESVWHAKNALANWLRSGVTTAATMGAPERLDKDLADCIKREILTGPEIIPALQPLVPAGGADFPWGYGVREVNGQDDARRAVRELIKQGADRIVVYADVPLVFSADPNVTARERLNFSKAELSEMVSEAKHAGCFVHAQAISRKAIELCASAGVRSIGCGFQLDRELFPIMRENNVAVAPNLSLGSTVGKYGPEIGISRSMVDLVVSQRISGQTLLEARDFGIDIVCGTNAALMQGDVVEECYCLKEIGFSAREILQSATVKAASAVKPYSIVGSFKQNNLADLLVLEGNPLENLDTLNQIREVMLRGKFINLNSGGDARE
ncbi:MAG: amidohydrolase family protein [Brevefilum sp.]